MRIVKLKGMRQVNGLHYAPDGRRLLAVGGYEVRSIDEARWVDVIAGTETLRVPLNASCYAASQDLTRMAVDSEKSQDRDAEISSIVVMNPSSPNREWGEHDRQEVSLGDNAHNSTATIYGMALAPDGERLAISFQAADTGGTYYVRFLIASRDSFHSMARADASGSCSSLLTFSPDGTWIAASDGSEVSGIDSRALTWRGVYETTGNQIRKLVFSPDGSTLAVANAKSVLLLPPDLSAPRHTLTHPKQVNAVAFTPDGRRILTTSTDKLVRVWDATTGQLVVSYDWSVGVTNAIAVAPDGLTAAVSGQTGRVVLFDLDG